MIKISLLFTCLIFSMTALAQLTININSVPENTPQSDDIYIAGNLNGWEPGDVSYILNDNQNGTYSIIIEPQVGQLQFKFTRGTWSTVEGNENGGFLPDRTYDYTGGVAVLDVNILSWEDLGGSGGAGSTAADNVFIMDDDFYMPQLDRTRRVWIYLPPDYETSDKDYPVLYLQDGQNLFDASTSFSGEWEVDETLNSLHAQGDYGCIVIGIENGGALRLDEYSPWINSQYSAGGEGDEYIEFIVNDLKPYVDANYRTLSSQEYTGIGGSSMGGLISHYAGLEYQNTFGKVAAFSCSFWFSDQSYTQVGDVGDQGDMKFYYIVGQGEGQQMVDDTEGMVQLMAANGFSADELSKHIHADGQHSEWYWRREFGAAYQWLFADLTASDLSVVTNKKIQLYPNPTKGKINILNHDIARGGEILVYAMNGQLLHSEALEEEINIQNLPSGVYLVKIMSNQKFIFADKIIVE